MLAILIAHSAAAQSPRYETLYSFKGSPDGADPKGALPIGKSGELYGATFAGGTSVLGTVFVSPPPDSPGRKPSSTISPAPTDNIPNPP